MVPFAVRYYGFTGRGKSGANLASAVVSLPGHTVRPAEPLAAFLVGAANFQEGFLE
jgi:hypothetical protein